MPDEVSGIFDTILLHVPDHARQYTDSIAQYVEQRFDMAAEATRRLLGPEWLPHTTNKSAQPVVKAVLRPRAAASYLDRTHSFLARHKLLCGLLVLAVGGGAAYEIYRRTRPRRRRRARRAANSNARIEVVVLASPPSEPITRALALDLERRGFIVYIVCYNEQDAALVRQESRADIRALVIDHGDPVQATMAVREFGDFLKAKHHAFHGAKSHRLCLRSILLIPPLTCAAAPVAALTNGAFEDGLHTHLTQPIATLQALLPLITTPHNDQTVQIPTTATSILIFTPAIIPSLAPPFHSLESTTANAMATLAAVLAEEVRPFEIPVTHVRLGNLDFSTTLLHRDTPEGQWEREQIQTWSREARETYASTFIRTSMGFSTTRGCGASSRQAKGTSLRKLNDRVFDLMIEGRGGTVNLGLGSSIYGLIGSWVPRSLLSWILRARTARLSTNVEDARLKRHASVRQSLLSNSVFGNASRTSAGTRRSAESDGFVPVYGDDEGPSAWKEQHDSAAAEEAGMDFELNEKNMRALAEQDAWQRSWLSSKGDTEDRAEK